jgi:ACR3 family arsenite transporter
MLAPNSTSVAIDSAQRSQHVADVEKLDTDLEGAGETTERTSVFKRLGILDRFLAVWIFLAMAIGVILGNFVPNTGPALRKGHFVGVSIPIGL